MRAVTAVVIAGLLGTAPLAAVAPATAQVTELDASLAYSAIMSAGSRAAQVARLRNVPSVGVVRLDIRRSPAWDNGSIPSIYEYRNLAAKHAGGIARLQRALRVNSVTRHALAARGIDVYRVVGVQVSSNGSLRLYLL
jgi:hypothetical protein